MGWFEPEYAKNERMFNKAIEQLAEPWSNDRIKKLKNNNVKKIHIEISHQTIPSISIAVEAASTIMDCLSKKFFNPLIAHLSNSPYWGYSHLFYEMSANYLAACLYFFAHFDVPNSDELYKTNSKFVHILFFLNHDIFDQLEVLKTNNEVYPLILPVINLYDRRDLYPLVTAHFEIFFGRILSKENVWLMTGEDFYYYPSIDGSLDAHLDRLYKACQNDINNMITLIYKKPYESNVKKSKSPLYHKKKEKGEQDIPPADVSSLPSGDESVRVLSYEEILNERYLDSQSHFETLVECNCENSMVNPIYCEMLSSEAFRVLMCQPSTLSEASHLSIRNFQD